MAISQAYRFALDPSPDQERCLRSHAGAARFAWNWGLARCKERYEAERKWYSSVDLHRQWNAAKKADPALAWWAENSKCVYQESFRDLERGLKDFMRSRKGERRGKRLGFPRFKKRCRCRDVPILHWGDPLRWADGHAAPAGRDPHLRVHPETGPQGRERHGAHRVGHGVSHSTAVVRVLHCRS